MNKTISYFSRGETKFRDLTIAIILWFIVYSFLHDDKTGIQIANLFTSLIVLFGILAVSREKKRVILGLLLGTPWLIISWVDLLIIQLPPTFLMIGNVFLISFLAFTAVVILIYILQSNEVSSDILFGAVAIYFLIGGTWSTVYILLETMMPGSFTNNMNGAVQMTDFVYYSYVTLTTLGYGDIVPVSSYAKSLAILEAITGVMYLAVIIGRFVGMYIAKGVNR